MTERPLFHAEIGVELAEARQRKGWSQRQAADLARRKGLRLGLGALRFLEQGMTKHPDAEVLKAVSVLYGLSFRDLAARFVERNYGSDLIGHAGTEQSRPPHGGSVDVAAASRIFELEQALADREATIDEMRELAGRLVTIAATSTEGHAARSASPPRSGHRRGHRR